MENLAEDPSQTLERNKQVKSFQNRDSDHCSPNPLCVQKFLDRKAVVEKLCHPFRVGWGGEILFSYKYVTPSGFLIYALSAICQVGYALSFGFYNMLSLRDF
jgi:hypothetical protein